MNSVATLVKPDLSMLSGVLQEQVIRKFLRSELIPADWSCQNRSLIENLQSLYETSNKRIQMYGSPEDLEISLMNFTSFPGNQQFFQFNDSACYKTYVSVYHSLGNVAYIYKKDMYDLLSEYTPKFETLAPLQKLAHDLVGYYLRIRRNQMPSSHEMIPVNSLVMNNHMESTQIFEMMMANNHWEEYETIFPFDPKVSGQVLNCISNSLAQSKVKIGNGLKKMINKVTHDVPVDKNVTEYKKILTWLDITVKYFEKMINKNEMMMLSRIKTVDSIPSLKIPIRLFESNQEKVVVSHELLHAIKLEKLDVSAFEEKILAMPKLSAMSFREVFEMVPSEIFKMLEFIKIPLRGGSNELTIIPMIDGSYCLTTYQFLLVVLNDVVLVKRLFQGMKRDQWPPIMSEFYNILVDTLRHESYFMTYGTFERMKSFFGTWFNRNVTSPNQIEILNVDKDGFTNEDLKVQLERLELSDVFPGIENTVDMSRVNPPTNGCQYEATKQMLQRVQDCQLAYVLDCLPKQLTRILHDRKCCGRLLLKPCPLCSKKQNEPSVKTKEDSKLSVERETVEEEQNLTETVVISPDASSSDEPTETSSTEKPDVSVPDNLNTPARVESVVMEQQAPTPKPKKGKKKIEMPAVKPEVKESRACPKCIRASEYTVKTNEKLRLSKIEVKHLRKELSVVELALEEKDERIRILEEKLREKENQVSLKNSEVESLSTKNQELENKNKRNERLIATSQKVISKKDVAIKSLQCHNYEKDKLINELMSEESKAIPPRSSEESEKVDSLLSNLLETKAILSKEAPLKKSSDICDSLISKISFKVTQQLVKYETKVFQLQVSSYNRIVENNIKLIRGNQAIKLDQIPEVPDFPEFSEEFKNVHKSIMKKEAPLLCRQLLKLTDEIADMECVICITDMECHDGTTKCGHCKRRYHNHCIRDWLKKKSICPTCKHGMVDEQEFPAL